MSDPGDYNNTRRGADDVGDDQPQRSATFKRSRWPGLIWAAPLAALLIVLWLGLKAYLSSGPEVHVIFPITGGLKAGNTDVKYKGATVGTVSAVKIEKSLQKMDVSLTFHSVMADHLGKGTRFWIAGNTVSFSDLSSLKSIISGPFIGIDPRPGKTVHHFTGLGKPPVLKTEPSGETLTLVTSKLGNISEGSPIYYRDLKVGEVQGTKLVPSGDQFRIYAFIDQKSEHLIDAETHFWDAGAVHVSTGGSGPSLQIQSIPALVMGAIAFSTPKSDVPVPPLTKGAMYKLYKSEDAAKNAPTAHAVPYTVVLQGGPHGLSSGANVEMDGARVGEVTGVHMVYDPAQTSLETHVLLALEPRELPLASGQKWNMANPRPQMNDIMNALIGHGLRAQMGSSVPVVGGKIIQLSMVNGSGPAKLGPGNPPVIPSTSGGGSGQIMSQVSDILAKINALPLPQIASNIQDVTKRVAEVSNSPQAKQTLVHLDQTMTHLDDISKTTNNQLPHILADIRQTTMEAQAALKSAQGLLNSQSAASANPESGTLPHALYELSRAARSLRELTDYLNEHPNSLLFGKGR